VVETKKSINNMNKKRNNYKKWKIKRLFRLISKKYVEKRRGVWYIIDAKLALDG